MRLMHVDGCWCLLMHVMLEVHWAWHFHPGGRLRGEDCLAWTSLSSIGGVWESDPWLQPGRSSAVDCGTDRVFGPKLCVNPFPGELRIVLARGEGGKGKKWETRSSGILQYCSASIRPLQTSTKLTFNHTTKFNHLQLQGLVQKYGIAANPTELLKRPGQPRTPEAWSWVGPGSAGSW